MPLKSASLAGPKSWFAVRARTAVQIIPPVGLASIALLIDLKTPGEIADGFLYILAVLFCVWIPVPNAALYTALGLMVPMIFGFFASPPASVSPSWTVVANRTLGVVLTWLIALVVWRLSKLNQDRERTLAELQRLRDLEERIAAEERVELSRWLHDGLAQELAAVGWGIDRFMAPERSAGALEDARSLRASVDEALRTVHRKAVELRKPNIQPGSLTALVERHVADFTGRTGLPVDLAGVNCLKAVPLVHAAVCLNVVQEALTNVVKHARASRVIIEFREEPTVVCVAITDDGEGFDAGDRLKPDSLGLLGLHERLIAIGGELAVSNASPRGVRTEAWIPRD